MARILFKGSTHFPGVNQSGLHAAADALGFAAAERGHTLLIGSESENTVDHHVKRGVDRLCRTFPDRQARVEIHRPDDGKAPFGSPGAANLHIHRQLYSVSTGAHARSDLNWVVAHVGALDGSDVLLLLGGGDGTELAARVAIERQWPVIPVAFFGGAASRIYDVLAYQLRRQPVVGRSLHLLNGPWRDEHAGQVIELIEQLVTRAGPHSYFISYSHADAPVADRVEVLLQRQGRGILRDERVLSPGQRLDSTLTTRIANANTFVVLYSRSYAASDYCSGELALAHDLRRSGKKPARIVGLRLDQFELSPLLAGSLWLDAGSRQELDSAVQRVLAAEANDERGENRPCGSAAVTTPIRRRHAPV